MIASVVAAGSHMVDEARMRDLLSESDIVIAADGGMDALERIGSVPDYVIGDFDSLRGNRQDHSRDFDPTIEVIEYPTRKSMTDMELSLELALEKGATKAYVFGGLGTRIDHSFINVMMLIPFYERGLAITVIDDTNEICYLNGDLTLQPRSEEWYVSFLPIDLKGAVISLEGFDYPLDHQYVAFGSSLAISNHVVRSDALVQIHEGAVFCVFSRDQYPSKQR